MAIGWKGWGWQFGLVSALVMGGVMSASIENSAFAQLTPDATLGTERSVVTPNATVRGLPAVLINGGALRGTNLFHSFLEFNVANGQRVYFANPAGIENILSRVTGNNLSNIFGTLGVDGGANLFLINPNGIIFGANARLDVAGSFVASTASSLVFENGSKFSATHPEAPPLLTIKVTPGLQYGTNQPRATIANAGNLAVGQNLTLAAGNLDLQGQLQAGKDLTLQALDTVKVRDSVTSSFIASAGERLLVQGNQSVDIFALNHPASGFFSGGDMVLRSPNSVMGDAHYSTGGNFRIEQPDGGLGNLESPNDPIIRASGNVSFTSYTGASLHILAGGSVNIDSVIITGTDATNFINEIVTLSNGTRKVTVNGSTQPTLDVRAGTTAFGAPANTCTGCPFFQPIGLKFSNTPPQRADININQISLNRGNGLVLLTNQYQPNTVPGNIQVRQIRTGADGPFQFPGNGGEIVMDSRGDIIIPESSPSYPKNSTIKTNSTYGNAGDITLIANGSFIMKGGQLGAPNYGQGNAGNINILVGDSVLLTNGSRLFTDSQGQGNAGNINIVAGNAVSLMDGSFISTDMSSRGTGKGGNIQINALGSVNLSGSSSITGLSTGLHADTREGASGQAGSIVINTGNFSVADGAIVSASTFNASDGGDITIIANSLELLRGGQVLALTRSNGNSGNVSLNIANTATISSVDPNYANRLSQFGLNVVTNELDGSGIFTGGLIGGLIFGSTGNSGSLLLNARQLNVSDGGVVSTASLGANTGSLSITSIEGIDVINQGTITTSSSTKNSGNLSISTGRLNISDRGLILTVSGGTGNAGDLSINATNSMNVSNQGLVSTAIGESSTGNSGMLSISTKQLNVSGEGQITTDSRGAGNAGNLLINATDSVNVSNQGLLTTGSFGSGNGGILSIRTGRLNVINGGMEGGISTAALGTGNSGNLSIIAPDSINVVSGSNIITSAKKGVAGSLYLETGRLSIRDNSFVVTTTFGAGNAGDLTVRAADSVEVVNGSKLSANTFGLGNGGNVLIETGTLSVRNGGEVSTVVTDTGSGNAGTLRVRAGNSIEVDGGKMATDTFGSGNGGNLIIDTGKLSVRNRGEVSTGVFDTSSGQGGNLTVTASDSVELMGGSLATATLGAGRAGDLTVLTRKLIARDGGRVEAGTLGIGKGGNVAVNASESIDLSGFYTQDNLLVFSGVSAKSEGRGSGGSGKVTLTTGDLSIGDGAEIATSTLGTGAGGNVQIQANSISLANAGNITSRTGGQGHGGNIQAQANTLSLTNNGNISSRSDGQGNAGDIFLNVNDRLGSSGGIISATSTQSGGGNINIAVKDSIRLDNSSLISTSVKTGAGGGGNIKINSTIFLALEDSDILANAADGRGGDITIRSPGFVADLFASGKATAVGRNPGDFFQFRGNGRVDISVDSQTSPSGTRSIPNILDTRGLSELPSSLVDAEKLIDRRCTAGGEAQGRSSFTVTGRGGLPPNPTEPLRGEAVVTNWVSFDSKEENRDRTTTHSHPISTSPKQLVEAQGWIIDPNGKVILIAQAPTATPRNPWQTTPSCQSSSATTR